MSISSIVKLFRPAVGISNQEARELWLEETLRSIPEGSKILDAGAGTQQHRKYCEHLNYVSQDFGEYDGQGDSLGLQMGEFDYGKIDIISDITSIPVADESFDVIMCTEVLEHVSDPLLVIKEFSRILRRDGHLIITAPFCSLTHFAPYHFNTGFNKYWYEEHLKKNKFNIDVMTPNGNFFEFLAQENYRIPSIASRYSKNKPNLLEMFCLYIVQKMLLRFSQKDNGSSEILCFGYHVVARKT